MSPAISSRDVSISPPHQPLFAMLPKYKRGRKASAIRSPSFSSASSAAASGSSTTLASTSSSSSASKRHAPYPQPTFLFTLLDTSTPSESEHLLSTSNTRYPGAPGTALYKARETAAKAAQSAKREADKKRREKEELARLGVGEKMGKRSREHAASSRAGKRSESPYTTTNNGGTSGTATPRRSQRDKESVAPPATTTNGKASSNANGKNGSSSSSGSLDHDSLPVPSVSSNGRLRRPASRGSSPLPLTAAPHENGISTPDRQASPAPSSALLNGTASTSSSVTSANAGPSASSNAANGSTPQLGSNSTNGSPVMASSARLGATATSQPFQSSPLARDSMRFPSTTAQINIESPSEDSITTANASPAVASTARMGSTSNGEDVQMKADETITGAGAVDEGPAA